MGNNINTYKPEQLKDDLAGVRYWLISNKIKLENSRFEQIYNNFIEIIEYSNQKKINEYVKLYGFDTYLYSSLDAFSYIEIYRALSKQTNLPQKKLRDKLNEIIKGPFLPKDENPLISNVNSRNIFFELELASILLKKGISITDLDDIQFQYDFYNFHIDCKRLISRDKIEYNIKKAYNQLKGKLNNSNDRGIIALCLDKLPKIDDKVFPTNNPNEIQKQLNLIGDIFRNNHQSIWEKFINTKIISVFLFIKFISILNDEKILYSWQIDLIPLCENKLQINEFNLLKRLAESLK